MSVLNLNTWSVSVNFKDKHSPSYKRLFEKHKLVEIVIVLFSLLVTPSCVSLWKWLLCLHNNKNENLELSHFFFDYFISNEMKIVHFCLRFIFNFICLSFLLQMINRCKISMFLSSFSSFLFIYNEEKTVYCNKIAWAKCPYVAYAQNIMKQWDAD